MPDIGLMREPTGPGRKVCVIGAGISGLVAAKVMRGRGYDVTMVEKSGDLGGVWEPARSYPGVRTQTPRDLYCFSDVPMPAEYPEWPSGAQMHAYLDAYAQRFRLRPCIRFQTEVLSLVRQPSAQGWLVTLHSADAATATEHFDIVLIATGQFSRPRTMNVPGEDAFVAAGGTIRHSSRYGDGAVAKGRDVAVVGFAKSATDIAMDALAQGARTVSMIYRQASWKIPYFFGGVVNFKHILYCRASEVMFMSWAPSRAGRFARTLVAPAIWANWRALEALLGLQFGLKKAGLRPTTRIEDSIHCSTSIETPGFYKAVRDGRIRMVQGDVTGYGPGCAMVGDTRVAADVVVLATGWLQDLPFLDAETRARLIEPDGQYRLHRLLVNPDLPGLGFVGFNSSFASALSAELGVHWLARYFEGKLQRQPTEAAMRAGIARALSWRRQERQVAATYGGLCIAPFHHAHFDELMEDMGAKTKPTNVLTAHLAPINPRAYAKLLETASGHDQASERIAR